MAKRSTTTPTIDGIKALRSDEAEILSKRLEHYAKTKGIKTINALAVHFDINYQTLLGVMESERCGSYDVTKKLCDKLGIPSTEKRNFFEKYSDYHVDAQHVLDDLINKKILFSKALSDLSQFSDKPLAELFAPLIHEKRTPLSTIKHWMANGSVDYPPLSKIRILAKDVFDLTAQQQQTLCECAGCYLDIKHIEKRLLDSQAPITAANAARGLMTLIADSTTAYAREKKIDPETAVRWASGKAPRKALISLMEESGAMTAHSGWGEQAKRKILEGHGFYLNEHHVMEKFKESDDFYGLIDALKSTFSITDADFGVQEGTVQRGRDGRAITKEETADIYFRMLSSTIPNFEQHRETFDAVFSRYKSCNNGTHKAKLSEQRDAPAKSGNGATR